MADLTTVLSERKPRMDDFTKYFVTLAVTSAAVGVVGICISRRNNDRTSALPLGPTSLRSMRDLFCFKEYPWLTYTRWAREYGSIYSYNVFGMWRVVVLNDIDAYSSVLGASQIATRPRFIVAGELMDFNRMTALLPQGPVLRMHRRLAHMVLNPEAVRNFSTVQEDAIQRCIVAIRKRPDAFTELRFGPLRSIVEMVYGLKLQTPDDPFVKEADIVITELGQALLPGYYLADTIPILKHVPVWFIGASFKRHALQVRKKLGAMLDYPYNFSKQLMDLGNSPKSFVSDALKRISNGELIGCTEETISDVAGTMYGAAVDTTFSVLLTIILGACLHSAKQACAHEEIDRVVGRERLPRLADSDSLPYVRAMIKEAMRLYPIGPLGLSRVANDDSVINGVFIPKGSIVIPNVWAISREPGGCGFPPEEFHPERFLSLSPPPDPSTYSFGAGKRNCIGKTVAENFIFAIVPALLATYEIKPPLSSSGQELPVQVEWQNSALLYPKFDCQFVVRNEALLNHLE